MISKTRDRLFWEAMHRAVTGLAAAIKQYKLDGEEPEPIVVQRYVQVGPPDPRAAAEFFRSLGVKVVD